MLPDFLMRAVCEGSFASCMQAVQPVADVIVIGCALISVAPALVGGVCGTLWRSVARR